MTDHITIRGARLHNLKNVTLTIPKNQLVVLTGVSGSGKSTLGFDILNKEGQRQYLESLGLVAFGLAKPPVDTITGLSPTISVDQHLTNRSPPSTVGTATEVYTYLRVLFARLGRRPCPTWGKDVPPSFDPSNAEWESESSGDDDASAPEETFPVHHCGAPIPGAGMAYFSFNKPAGACPTCTGLGSVHQANIKRLVDEQKSIPDGAVAGWDLFHINYYTSPLQTAAAHYGFVFDLSLPVKDYTPPQRDLLFFGVDSPLFRRHFPNIEPPTTVRQGRFEGIATNLLRRYAEHIHEHIHEADYRDKLEEFLVTQTCPDCAGTRLRPESRVVTVNGQTIIAVSRRLRDLGNTVLVIEHDLEMIVAADYVVDFGPGAGKHGGLVVAAGTPAEVAGQPGSLTGDYLARRASIPVPQRRRAPNGKAITIHGARRHNLQDVTVRLPLGLLVAVTGVSGSGKSSLVFDILDRAIRRRLYGSSDAPGEHDAIEGCEYLDKIITIDQEHIGRIPRSNAATYSDTFTPIREAFAATPEARRRGLSARHFSFNVPGGRCERCEGAGVLTVKMQLLLDVEVRCPACHGRRFTRETLAVRYHDHDISQVLDLTIEEALALFKDVPAALSRLQVLSDVGLGYLQLGQPATTLSGGEAQRVKLAKELGRRVTGRTLYLLDEPTTGLHLADTARWLGGLH